MNRLVRIASIGVLCVTCVAGARSAAAQTGGTPSSKPIDLSIGYQFTHTPDVNLPLGFGVDVAVPLNDMLSVVGEFAWGRNSNADVLGLDTSVSQTLTTFGAGVRWNAPSSDQFTPYVQVLGGAARAAIGDVTFAGTTIPGTSDTKFMLQPGVGVSAGFGTGVRAFGEVDYRRVFADPGENEFRLLLGVTFRFAR
jgi:hypothetical protein